MSSENSFNGKQLIERENNENVWQNTCPLSERQRNLIIERIVGILSDRRLTPWFADGLYGEYQKRYSECLPQDWIRILEDCGRHVIEVETMVLSNVSKTLIQLPRIPTPVKHSDPELVTTVQPIRQQEVCGDSTRQTNAYKDPNDRQLANSWRRNAVNGHNFIKAFAVLKGLTYGNKSISAPLLPPVRPTPMNSNDFFDVVVLLAANPFHFIVVPYLSITQNSKFNELKQKMFAFYEIDKNRIDLPPEVCSEGKFFAVKARNGWSRMQIKSIICYEPFKVVGYLCDYGEHMTVELKHIQPLYNEFMEDSAQAIRASLADVEPIHAVWDEMTNDQFRRLVAEKPFVSTVYAINEVDGQTVLSLSLCDTSGSEDVYISNILCDKGMAKPKITNV